MEIHYVYLLYEYLVKQATLFKDAVYIFTLLFLNFYNSGNAVFLLYTTIFYILKSFSFFI